MPVQPRSLPLQDSHLLWSTLPGGSGRVLGLKNWSYNPKAQALWFGLLRVRSPLLTESMSLSAPPGTEMFQFPGFPLPFGSHRCSHLRGFPIRTSPSHRLSPARRGFSQVTASFIGSSARASTVDPSSLDLYSIQVHTGPKARLVLVLLASSVVMHRSPSGPASFEAQKEYRATPSLSTPLP